MQTAGGQLIEVPGIQVDHAGSGGRWRLESDQVVALRIAQQFLATVTQAHIDPRIGRGIEIAFEQGGRLDHRRQQFGDHAMFQAGVAGQGARGDAGTEPDHQCRARLTVVDQQGQQRLDPHVAQGRHGVTGIGYALNVQTLECPFSLALGDHGDGAATAFFVERQRAIARARQQAGELVDRREHGERQGHQANGNHRLTPAFLHTMALAHGEVRDTGGDHRQQAQGPYQTQHRDQDKAAEHHADNPAKGIERDDFADMAPHLFAADAQAQGQGERSPQQQGRYKHDAQGSHRKPRAHASQFTAAQ
ncbi:hypothetical protein D3C80_949450 [compost metagenome]